MLTDRGDEIARLVPADGRGTALDRLVADCGARRAEGDLLALLPPVEELATGRPSADVLDELREEHF